MSERLRNILFNWQVKYLFKGIRAEDIILFNRDRSKAFIQGQEVPRERMVQLKEEAERFENSWLWKEVLEKNLRYTAQERGMSRKDKELPMGQAMIVNLDVIKKAIRDIKDFKIGEIK